VQRPAPRTGVEGAATAWSTEALCTTTGLPRPKRTVTPIANAGSCGPVSDRSHVMSASAAAFTATISEISIRIAKNVGNLRVAVDLIQQCDEIAEAITEMDLQELHRRSRGRLPLGFFAAPTLALLVIGQKYLSEHLNKCAACPLALVDKLLCCQARDLGSPFVDAPHVVVTAMIVLEHFQAERGQLLIHEFEYVVRIRFPIYRSDRFVILVLTFCSPSFQIISTKRTFGYSIN